MRYKVLFSLAAILSISSCNSDFYSIVIEFERNFELRENAPIYYDDSYVRWESILNDDEGKRYLKVLVPDSVKIPIGSQFVYGYVDFLRSKGLSISSSNSSDYINKSDTVRGVYKEEIVIKLKETDPELVDKVRNIMKDLIDAKRDSTRSE